ncbi:primase-helicase family protein [Acidisoma silvae]|uniref:NrS-1 polymerase-like helicase domain-containing protein n=1 Tax=Acidisoma silvae TaxID=2802396 RepID=A0A963YVI0_9PROT|nr:primase-helicase family protein [Acidisoma silvae]MCB8877599.1 hypothetical protein [Acidisoma silvae]
MDAIFSDPEDVADFVKKAGAPAAPKDCDAETLAVVKRLNKKYSLVNEGGKAVIFQTAYDPLLKRRRIDRLSSRDLQTLYLNEKVETGVDDQKRPVYKTVANIWLNHPERRQFIDGVTFDPTTTKSEAGVLNLWEGFAITPALGDWSLLRSHIHQIICDGDRGHFDYLMGWMARMVQRPAEQGEVAVVMKGGEGTGKGTLAKALLKIMGQHGIAISNAKHLTGNFNGHLRDAIMLFADEAFFAGDRAHVGVLKSIITEPYLTVEAKFQNAVQMPNFLHLMMASNEEWVVPASLDARRFFVLEVVDAAKNNHEYFAAIWAQMEAGGYGAMLHDLLALDLTHFNVRAVPVTEGLQQQRKLSLPIPEAWWQDCLARGYVFRSRLGLEKHFAQWHDVISTELLFASYAEFAKERHERRPMTREQFGHFMRRMGGNPVRPRKGFGGEHIVDETNAFGGSARTAKPIEMTRPFSYKTGNLGDARAAFCEATKLEVTWGTDEMFPEAAE